MILPVITSLEHIIYLLILTDELESVAIILSMHPLLQNHGEIVIDKASFSSTTRNCSSDSTLFVVILPVIASLEHQSTY